MNAPDNPLIDEDIERAALGCLMQHNEAAGVALADYGLKAEMFYHPAHSSICQTIYELYDTKSGYIDALMVQNRLKTKGILEECGGFTYLMSCIECSPVSIRQNEYYQKIKDMFMKRQIIKTAEDLIEETRKSTEGSEFVLSAPQRFYDLIPSATDDDKTVEESLRESLAVWRDIASGKRQLPGLSTGIDHIDHVMGGLKPGYHIIAARPSAGKTSLAGQIAEHFAREGRSVAWVNMDMPRADLYERNVARAANVSLAKLTAPERGGTKFAGEKNFAQVEAAIAEMKDWPIEYLHAEFDVAKICSWIRMQKMRNDTKLVVIDYIQKCRAPHIKSYDPVRVLSESSAAIKVLGQQLEIPILVLAQLNRGNIRDSRKPTLADLKGCGDFEQDAQSCILLYKEEKFPYDQCKNINEATQRAIWLDIAKQQNGGIGEQEFWLHGCYFKMVKASQFWGYPELFA